MPIALIRTILLVAVAALTIGDQSLSICSFAFSASSTTLLMVSCLIFAASRSSSGGSGFYRPATSTRGVAVAAPEFRPMS